MSNERIDGFKSNPAGPLKDTKGPGQTPGTPPARQHGIGNDKDGRGLDPDSAMRGTGRLPKLDGEGIPEIGHETLNKLRQATGKLAALPDETKHMLAKVEALTAKGQGDVSQAYHSAADDAHQAIGGARDAWHTVRDGVGDGVKAVKGVEGDIKLGMSGVVTGTSLKQLVASFNAVNEAGKVAEEAGAMAEAGAKLGGKIAQGAEEGALAAEEVSTFARVAAGVAVVGALADAGYESYRATQWDSLNDANRAAVTCNLASDALAIAGTFSPPPADAVLLGVGAAFALAGVAATYWPEEKAGLEIAGKAIAGEGKQAGRAIAGESKQLGKDVSKEAQQAADKTANAAKSAANTVGNAAKGAVESSTHSIKKAFKKIHF